MELVVPQRAGVAADAIDDVVPRHVAEPESPEAFAQTLALASTGRMQTVIRGGGTKIGWGRTPAAIDLVVSTARLNRLIIHRHGDLTATVQAGMRLQDLNDVLRAQGQWLPLESAFAGATVGGLVATNDAGPARHRNGTPRDLVIGMTLALTDGRLIKSGGTVVKNVAGYDLGKLVSGSHGTLAGIAEITFKLVPIPQASSTLLVAYADADAMTRDVAALAASQVEPAAFDVSVGTAIDHPAADGTQDHLYKLHLRVATSPAATDAQLAAARALVSGDAAVVSRAWDRTLPPAHVAGLGDPETLMWQSHVAAAWRGDAAVRLSWLPARLPAVVELTTSMQGATGAAATLVGRAAGTGIMRLVGPPPALAAAVNRLRASQDVGHVILLRASRELKALVDVWGPPPDADRVLHSLKQMFDPNGILNAGRGPIQ
jgi:glycolate oxidase FAD binding subunit